MYVCTVCLYFRHRVTGLSNYIWMLVNKNRQWYKLYKSSRMGRILWVMYYIGKMYYGNAELAKHVNAVGPRFGPVRGEMGPNMKMQILQGKSPKSFWRWCGSVIFFGTGKEVYVGTSATHRTLHGIRKAIVSESTTKTTLDVPKRRECAFTVARCSKAGEDFGSNSAECLIWALLPIGNIRHCFQAPHPP